MHGTELPDYVNQPPKPEAGQRANHTEGKIYTLALLFLGLLFLAQATLNVALRLSLVPADGLSMLECNHTSENSPATEEVRNNHCNRLQERFNAVTRDKNQLENRISVLNNKIKDTEEERDRLSLRLESLQKHEPCPTGWISLLNKCYYISEESKTWQNSRSDCQSRGADLVVINSRDEQFSLFKEIVKYDEAVVWIGLSDMRQPYRWVDGSDLTLQFWQKNQPDHGGLTTRQDCVEMDTGYRPEQSWDDVACTKRNRWVCEMERNCNPVVIIP